VLFRSNLLTKYIDVAELGEYSCSFRETESGGAVGTVFANWYDREKGEFNIGGQLYMYSDKFLKAFEYLMYHEGGYVNDKADAGGETKYGISKRSYPSLDIKNLTRDQACKIYFCDFWMKAKCEDINDKNIATKFFDLTVHTGIPQAVKLI
jgi:hypothetical protein